MNRRRILAWLGLAPIAAIPAVEALASDALASALFTIDHVAAAKDMLSQADEIDFWEAVKDCFIRDRGEILPFLVGPRDSRTGNFPIRYKICDGTRWVDCDSDGGRALMDNVAQ
jgi:hypothetical protein